MFVVFGAKYWASVLPRDFENTQILEGSQSSGVLALAITAMVSLLAVTGLLIAIAFSAWNTRKSPNPNLFVRTNIAPYFIMLLLSNFLQSIGSIMNARWVHMKLVQSGPFCTTQGVVKHLSDVGVAIWALTIAVHTFHVLFFQVFIPKWVMHSTLVMISLTTMFISSIGFVIGRVMGRGAFYGISGYWCWITDEYDMIRILLDYVIMYMSALISFILYLLVFFRMRGNIVVNGSYIRFRMAKSDDWRGREFSNNAGLRVAKQMLLYPVVYTMLILPMAVVRSCEWTGQTVPFKLVIFCDVIYQSAGIVNVILFTTTRRILPWQSILPWRQTEKTSLLPWNTAEADNNQNSGGGAGKEASLESAFHHVKIDNHVDNMLTQPPTSSGSSPDPSPPVTPRPPRPAAMQLNNSVPIQIMGWSDSPRLITHTGK